MGSFDSSRLFISTNHVSAFPSYGSLSDLALSIFPSYDSLSDFAISILWEPITVALFHLEAGMQEHAH